MILDKESRMAPAKKWILQKIAEVANDMGLKIRAEWNTTSVPNTTTSARWKRALPG